MSWLRAGSSPCAERSETLAINGRRPPRRTTVDAQIARAQSMSVLMTRTEKAVIAA